MNPRALTQFAIAIILFFTLTSCNTLFRGVDQRITVNTNVDSIKFYKDSSRVHVKNNSISIPRGEYVVLKAKKPGYESQNVVFYRIYGALPLNIFMGGFLGLIPAIIADDMTVSTGLSATMFFGFWTIGGMIDIASGSHFKHIPENIVVNLYPALKPQNSISASIVCSDFEFYDARFINALGSSYMYNQMQYIPIYLVDHKIINSPVSKDVINEYLSSLGYTVPGKKFYKDTVANFRIEAIVDSLQVNDSRMKADDKIIMNSEKTNGEIIRDLSEDYLYTHVQSKISWRITHVTSGRTIDKSIKTDIVYYAESIQSAYGKHLKTNFNQLLNDADVEQFLAGY